MDFGMIVAAAVMVATVFVTLCRVGPLRRWLGYSTYIDVAFTLMMFIAFHGTYSGIVAAAFAGLFMAGTLSCLRRTLGYEKLQWRKARWSEGIIRLSWISYAPKQFWTRSRTPLHTRLLRGLNALKLHRSSSQTA